MKKLSVSHNKRGVRSFQYSIVGVILIKTFVFCIGSEFEEMITQTWSRLFSVVLKFLIPLAIKVRSNISHHLEG